MKAMKVLLMILLFGTSAAFAQTSKQTPKTNYYFVSAPHTPEQCQKNLDEMKDKGDAFLGKFYFGCHSGDHTGYAFLQGTSEDEVRKMLPKEVRDNAKIEKVEKMTVAELENAHKQGTEKKK